MMTATSQPLTQRPAWKTLAAHYEQAREWHLRRLFAEDPKRGERMTAEAVGLYLDYSKNRITDQTLKLLIQLADESALRARIDAMFRGEKINLTENRAVLHVALRAPRGARSATCRTARFSVMLIFSPRNMASIAAARPDSSASRTRSLIVSPVTRFFE